MYNRYIPQPDGSYRRSRMPDTYAPTQRQHPQKEPEPPCHPEPIVPPCPEPPRNPPPCPRPRPRPQRHPTPPPREPVSIGNFFRGLLPRDFDTSDLLIILLLLLISGDCQEEQNTALLTLVLYLFL